MIPPDDSQPTKIRYGHDNPATQVKTDELGNGHAEMNTVPTARPRRPDEFRYKNPFARRPGESDQQWANRLQGELSKLNQAYPTGTAADIVRNEAVSAGQYSNIYNAISDDQGYPPFDHEMGIGQYAIDNPNLSPARQDLMDVAGDAHRYAGLIGGRSQAFGGQVLSGTGTMANAITEGPAGAAALGPAGGPTGVPEGAIPGARRPVPEDIANYSKAKPEEAPAKKPGKSGISTEDGVGDPVRVSNGEYLGTKVDFFIPGTLPFNGARYMGLALGLPSRYRSPLGLCQISAFDEIFVPYKRGELTFIDAQGREIGFERPFSHLPSHHVAFPHLELTAPWLRQLRLVDKRAVKQFRQYDDDIYRLEAVETLDGQVANFHRNSSGVLLRIDGPDGLSLTFDNEEERRVGITLIGTNGEVLSLARYAYDIAGRMVSADCAFGMSVRYEWARPQGGRQCLASWRNLTGSSQTRFSYDSHGHVIGTVTTGSWNGDRFEYDKEKRKTLYLPAGDIARAEVFVCDDDENVIEEINPLGNATRHEYDEAGRLTATTNPNGCTTHTSYDPWGYIKSFRDGEGRETLYGWGSGGTLDLLIDPVGNVYRAVHDEKARLISFTDAEKHVTAFSHDERGRLITIARPNGAVERRAYDERNRLVAVTDAKGGETRYEHDVFGRVTAVTDALGGVTRLAYGAGAGGFAVPTRLVRPDGVTVSRAYDREGTLATVSDGEGRQWHYEHGAFGVLEAIVDPKGGRLRFDYDSEGRLLAVTNANGQVWHFRRDVAGQVIAEEDYDGRRIDYERDIAGQVVAIRYVDGARRSFAYDKSGLLLREESFAPPAPSAEEGAADAEDITRYWYDDRSLLM